MTQQEKREVKLNKVLTIVRDAVISLDESELKKDCTNTINITGFLYSCGRLNDMQALTRLLGVAHKLNIDENAIMEALND